MVVRGLEVEGFQVLSFKVIAARNQVVPMRSHGGTKALANVLRILLGLCLRSCLLRMDVNWKSYRLLLGAKSGSTIDFLTD